MAWALQMQEQPVAIGQKQCGVSEGEEQVRCEGRKKVRLTHLYEVELERHFALALYLLSGKTNYLPATL